MYVLIKTWESVVADYGVKCCKQMIYIAKVNISLSYTAPSVPSAGTEP